MTKEEAQIACQEALEEAEAHWPKLDISTVAIIPVTRDRLDFSFGDGILIRAHRDVPADYKQRPEQIELGEVGKFVLGYNREHNVLAIKCYPENGQMIPVTI